MWIWSDGHWNVSGQEQRSKSISRILIIVADYVMHHPIVYIIGNDFILSDRCTGICRRGILYFSLIFYTITDLSIKSNFFYDITNVFYIITTKIRSITSIQIYMFFCKLLILLFWLRRGINNYPNLQFLTCVIIIQIYAFNRFFIWLHNHKSPSSYSSESNPFSKLFADVTEWINLILLQYYLIFHCC